MREAAAERRERPPDSPFLLLLLLPALVQPKSASNPSHQVTRWRKKRQEADEGKKFGGGES